MTTELLHRYTSFSSLAHMLLNERLTLLDPNGWDDRNDAYFIESYRKKVKAKKVFALCFTEAAQKYHHWSVFASGADGVCISFQKRELIQAVKVAGDFEFERVKYITTNQAERNTPFDNRGLKFTKNQRYSDEKEWRLIYTDLINETTNPSVEYDLRIIKRITVSPWLAKPLATSLHKLIRLMPGCSQIELRRSTLINYHEWMSIADRSI